MVQKADQQHGQAVDPKPSQPVDLDYPTLGRLVEAEADDLYESAELVNDELKSLTRDQDWVPAATIIDHELEVPRSPDELIARLNGIGQSACRLARHVRTLVGFRALHIARRAETEAGIWPDRRGDRGRAGPVRRRGGATGLTAPSGDLEPSSVWRDESPPSRTHDGGAATPVPRLL